MFLPPCRLGLYNTPIVPLQRGKNHPNETSCLPWVATRKDGNLETERWINSYVTGNTPLWSSLGIDWSIGWSPIKLSPTLSHKLIPKRWNTLHFIILKMLEWGGWESIESNRKKLWPLFNIKASDFWGHCSSKLTEA